MSDRFYKPRDAWAADFIPFYKDGVYHLFYLHDWRNPTVHGEGTPWYQISTNDFSQFTEHGEMLQRGTNHEQDLYVFTGSVVEGLGQYHIFYTGHNPYFRNEGKPEQGVMHAVSNDLLTWSKLPDDTFYAPVDRYEMHDWRDPFVFWNEQEGEFWMLLAARLKVGPSRRRGCTALCASKDLKSWKVREPFYAPGLYYTHECPDLFSMNGWWYLVFSEFSSKLVTRYRMARSLNGPWLTPDDDQFDGRAFYAAKSAGDGSNRYLFGWNPTREGASDHGVWNWGGNLVVHELIQHNDGSLRVCIPEMVENAWGNGNNVDLQPGAGLLRIDEAGSVLDGRGTFAYASAGRMPRQCKLETTITFLYKKTGNAGIALRTSDDFERSYYLRLEPTRGRLVFDLWPRPGDVPFMPELERPISVEVGRPVNLKILIDGSVCVVYMNDEIAMSTRLYDLQDGNWGVFVENTAIAIMATRII